MKLAVFSAHSYDRQYLSAVQDKRQARAPSPIELIFHDFSLSEDTVPLAHGADAVCVFVNDNLAEPVLEGLHAAGVRAILLRCAGYNNVDLKAAERLGLFVANVPSYSPEAVAEFTVALLQTLNRNTHRAYNRVREGNFKLDGLLGKTLHGKTVGIIGLGKIGLALARILNGYGCRLLACDPFPPEEFAKYGETTDLENLLPQCDFISLHCPLMDSTRHIINEHTLTQMKKGAILVNTSRGGLINTRSVIAALKSKQLGGLALDVYEGEGALFYRDHSGDIIDDDELMRLMTFHNVIVCGHQAFFTEEALTEIAESTLRNFDAFMYRMPCKNALVDAGHVNVRRDSLPVRT
ncbi:D-isomer specific 2-hydroxyacid dehydrogenase [Pleurostoma richardsiae]|uniref:D-isomer specific 2-hydroxyacid dehydrogenase n=1 Tax=Pleurostoma richardsiae TaxID=41990 RepID=A0AA38VXX8_9PEZI|nr:D-isomer specific 2-hydroxyacid dehydrogenase [Pleurostoma richardsiae]